MRRTLRRLGGLGVAALAIACAETVQVTESPTLRGGQPLAISRLAVAPFRAVQRPGAAPVPADAPELVAGYVADAFTRRGLDVVAASDVQTLAAVEPGAPPDPRALARAVHQRFGAGGLALGSVARFRDRSGQAMGSTQPASVSFEVKLYSAPDGNLVWSGIFDQTQVALSANLLQAPQYPGGGSRWLTAAEFGRWGADQLALQVPLAPR